jgi:hypothetical protein
LILNVDLLPHSIQNDLASAYCEAVLSIVKENRLPLSIINVSANELALALSEARKDLVIMVTRRISLTSKSSGPGKFDGLSIGKLAGILVFRLSRYRIFHVDTSSLAPEDLRALKLSSKLQELAALRFASETILKVHPLVWHPELLYVLSRRHINQEMLGITFDVIAAHCPNLATKSPLDKPPFDKFSSALRKTNVASSTPLLPDLGVGEQSHQPYPADDIACQGRQQEARQVFVPCHGSGKGGAGDLN